MKLFHKFKIDPKVKAKIFNSLRTNPEENIIKLVD